VSEFSEEEEDEDSDEELYEGAYSPKAPQTPGKGNADVVVEVQIKSEVLGQQKMKKLVAQKMSLCLYFQEK